MYCVTVSGETPVAAASRAASSKRPVATASLNWFSSAGVIVPGARDVGNSMPPAPTAPSSSSRAASM